MNRLKDHLVDKLQNLVSLMESESARQHHYYVGVEHLFMALTSLENGVTANAIQALGLSPRFVRHSVRTAAGPGDQQRHWPGFRTTPRYEKVVSLALELTTKRDAARVSERDLLQAVLHEPDSIPVRVLVGLGIDVGRLSAIATGLHDLPTATYPAIRITGATLDPGHVRVLSQMFSEYAELQIVRPFEGFSGATVLLVRPIKTDGRADANVVVKIDRARAVQYEKLRYDSHVKSTLPPVTARLADPPVVLDHPDIGALKYTFVGQYNAEHTRNLFDHVTVNGPGDLAHIIRNKVNNIFGQNWWAQHQPYSFALWQEYEHVLPPALVIQAEAVDGDQGRVLHPRARWSLDGSFNEGDIVTLEHFTVHRAYPDRDEVVLIAGAGPAAEDRANKVTVRGVTSQTAAQGDRMDRLVGRVVQTRHDILTEKAQQLFPDVNLEEQHIELLPGKEALPNPLAFYQRMLKATFLGQLSTIHGDLHLGNILIDPDHQVWLIDFTWSRDGHTLFDWAVLEVSILADVVAALMTGVEEVAQRLSALNMNEPIESFEDVQLNQAFDAVTTVREIVQGYLTNASKWGEYFAGFVMCALRAITWDTVTTEPKRLLFVAAALALERLVGDLPKHGLYDTTQAFGDERDVQTTSTTPPPPP